MRKFRVGFKNVIKWIINGFPDPLFIAVLNIVSRTRGSGVTFGFKSEGSETFFSVQSSDTVLLVPERIRLFLYAWGVESRHALLRHNYLLNLVTFEEGDIFVDIGANVGEIKNVCPSNLNYIAFEAGRREFDCLRRNHPLIDCFNLGAWNTSGTLAFYVKSDTADSSLIEPPEYDSVELIDVVRLDEHPLIRDVPSIKVLKIEAEGAEPEVLAGAEDILGKVEYIVVDTAFERGIQQTSTTVPIINFAMSRGYELVDMSYGRLILLFRRKTQE